MQSLYFELFHIFKPQNANLKKVIYFILLLLLVLQEILHGEK